MTDGPADPVRWVQPGSAADDFAAWVSPHLQVMSAVASRLVSGSDVGDVVQEALIRAWRRRGTYRPDRGTARAWLIAIVVDQGRRARQRNRLAPGSVELAGRPDASGPAGSLRLDVERALAQLPRRQQQTVALYYLADLSIAETAQVLGIRTGTVKAHLAAAREGLRAALEDT